MLHELISSKRPAPAPTPRSERSAPTPLAAPLTEGRAHPPPPTHPHIPPYPKTALLVRGLRLGGHDGELGRWRRQGLVHGRLLVLLGGAGLLRPAPMVVLGRLELGRRGSDDLQASPSSTRSAHARRRRPRDSRSSQIHLFVCTSSFLSLSLSLSLCLSLSLLLALRCLADARRQFLPQRIRKAPSSHKTKTFRKLCRGKCCPKHRRLRGQV